MRLSLAALLLSSTTAAASTFELTGAVLDESGFALPGVVLTLVHQSTGLTRTATTNEDGRYALSGLPPGVYSLEAGLSGYATVRYAGLKYFADTKPIFNITLRPREVQESMTFTGEAPLLNVSQSQVGLSVEERQLQELPLTRRDYLELAALDVATRPTGEGLSIDGANAHYSAYELDGLQNTRDQHGVVLVDAGLDVVEELRVVSGPFEAEHGGSFSGVVTAATNAGGNDWHGSLSAFFRPGSWDAPDPLTSENTSLDRQDVAFTLSGPLARERTHLFTGVEYENQDEDVVVTAPYDFGRFRGVYTLPSERLRALLKLSHTFDSENQLVVTGVFARESALEGVGGYDVFESALDTENDDVAINGTLVSSLGPALSELRFGFASERFRRSAAPPPLGFALRDPLAGNIGSPTRFERADEDHFELSESLALPRGEHSMKTGFRFLRIESGIELDRFGEGLVLVPSVAGAPTLTWQSVGTRSSLDRGESHFQAFFQDDWAISPYVTLNLGLRWEKETSVPDNDNFAPRLGVHWDATGDGRTSVRAGYGVFYSSVVSVVDTLEALYGSSGLGVVASADGLGGGVPNFYARAARRSPRSQQWSAGIEREWAPSLAIALDINYVRGADLLLPFDQNAPSFFDYTTGEMRSSASADRTRPFGVSEQRDLYLVDSRGSSRFWGLRVQATKRYQTSFTLQAAYLWSRATNDGDDYRIDESLPVDPARPELEWGRSANDIPHSFVASGLWDAPLGLRFAAIARARSGRPIDPRVGADLDGDLKLRERGFSNGRILERNSFRAGSVASLDLSVAKSWELSEARSFVIALDAFNVTNRLNPLKVLDTYGGSETRIPEFLQVVQAGPPRQFQLSVRFLF